MLSRVAERLYWMARYHERTEDLCRLTDAYTHLLMDLFPTVTSETRREIFWPYDSNNDHKA